MYKITKEQNNLVTYVQSNSDKVTYYRKNWEFFECPNLTQQNYTSWVYYNTLPNVWNIISKTDGGTFSLSFNLLG